MTKPAGVWHCQDVEVDQTGHLLDVADACYSVVGGKALTRDSKTQAGTSTNSSTGCQDFVCSLLAPKHQVLKGQQEKADLQKARQGKTVHIKVIDDEEYEKNKNFFIELMSPRMVDMSLQKGLTKTACSLGKLCPCSGNRKTVRVKIVDEEEYERQENFFIALGEPKWMERGISALLLTQDTVTVEFALKKHLSKDKSGHAGYRQDLESDRFASRDESQSVHHA
ncbi:hypothetical protein Q9233_005266 [Columba guinea]|nr:hypothetical protein Q9233_005266 [Columba guinea]